MSRSDQYIGLPEDAQEFLREYGMTPEPCPHCGRGYPMKTEKIGKFTGMFDDEYPLLRYQLKDGRHADEFLQADPWSSGPMFFIGLKVSDGQEILWHDDVINGY